MTNAMKKVNKEMLELKKTINGWENGWMEIAPNKACYEEDEHMLRVVGLIAEYSYTHSKLYYAAAINKVTRRPFAHSISLMDKNGNLEHITNFKLFHSELLNKAEIEALKKRFNPMA